jgi:siroheme synthase-like protein
MTHYYPINLNLNQRCCLIIGGEELALLKIPLLMHCNAKILMIASKIHADVYALAKQGKLILEERDVLEEDIKQAFLIIVATGDLELNTRVFDWAEIHQKLINSIDDVPHCNFIAPAIASQGHVQVAVSTSGHSPILASQLRDRIQQTFLTPDIGRWADFLGKWRPAVKKALPSLELRKILWRKVFDSPLKSLLDDCQEKKADQAMQILLEEFQYECLTPK